MAARDVKDLAYADWKKGMKYKDIAEKHDVKLSTVKSWAMRYWKQDKVATKTEKGCNQKKKSCNQKVGAPEGNQNAKGNKGGGAPEKNQNSLKHGAFAKVFYEQLEEEESKVLNDISDDAEEQLKQELILLTLRERRILKRIKDLQSQASKGQTLSRVISQKTKNYAGKLNQENISKSKSAHFYDSTTTETESVSNYISVLEAEMTKIQRAKTQTAKALSAHQLMREKLEMERDKDSYEIEDLGDVEGDIYG